MIRVTETERQLIERVSEWADRGRMRNDGLRRIKQDDLSCPSASNSHGDKVFAVFDESVGELRYLPDAVVVPEVAKSLLDMDAFALKNRLEGKCVTSSCHYWQGACHLGFFVSEVEVRDRVDTQKCSIRASCRWIKENGPEVCGSCVFVRNLPVQLVSIKSRQE
jgi:hypothetical protein